MTPPECSPRWLMPLFTFLCGIAMTAGLLTPLSSRDRRLGYLDGYADAMQDSKSYLVMEYRSGYQDGLRSAKR